MDDNNAQFKALVEGKTEFRDTNVRGVDGGFVIGAQRRWIDPATAQGVASIGLETVAATSEIAAAKVTNFLTTGSFDA